MARRTSRPRTGGPRATRVPPPVCGRASVPPRLPAVTSPLAIREIPRSERPRERLVSLGASALSTAELLAVLLGSGTTNQSTLQVAQQILGGASGSLRRIAMHPVAALTATHGVGIARAVTVHAALELGRRLAAEVREDGAPVRFPRDIVRF